MDKNNIIQVVVILIVFISFYLYLGYNIVLFEIEMEDQYAYNYIFKDKLILLRIFLWPIFLLIWIILMMKESIKKIYNDKYRR